MLSPFFQTNAIIVALISVVVVAHAKALDATITKADFRIKDMIAKDLIAKDLITMDMTGTVSIEKVSTCEITTKKDLTETGHTCLTEKSSIPKILIVVDLFVISNNI
jgi:hypothetical protein